MLCKRGERERTGRGDAYIFSLLRIRLFAPPVFVASSALVGIGMCTLVSREIVISFSIESQILGIL